MADIFHGTAQLANWLPTVFAPVADGYFKAGLGITNYCTNYSSALAPGAKAVTIPLIGARTADSKSTETAVEWTGFASAETAATITANQQAIEAFLIEKISELETNVPLMQTYARDSAYVLAKHMENYIAASIIQSATTNDVTLGTDNTITYAKLLEAQRQLNIDNVKLRECAFGMSPEAFEISVIEWNTNSGALYTSAAVMGERGFAATGAEGMILGAMIYVSDDWDGDGTTGDETASIWHPKAVGYVMAGGGPVTIGPSAQPLHGAEGFAVTLVYGATKMLDSGIANFNNP